MLPPIARSTDPGTSHRAAGAITGSGQRVSQVELCFQHVVDSPGKTAGEIGESTGLGHVRAQRRLSDLKTLGRIYAEGTSLFQGNSQNRLWPTQAQGVLL